MTQKLPAYFEKYFDQKFSDVNDNFLELKKHVNDEIQIIRVTLQSLERQVNRFHWMIALLFVLLLIHDVTDINIFNLIKELFIH